MAVNHQVGFSMDEEEHLMKTPFRFDHEEPIAIYYAYSKANGTNRIYMRT